MNGLLIGLAALAFLVGPGCALEDAGDRLGRVMERAAATGGHVRLVCPVPLERLEDCRPAVGVVNKH